MKKAFSLMELLIAVTILSIVMFSLIQIRTNNISLLSKVKEKAKWNDYILLSMDLENKDNRNEDLRIGDKYKFQNEELRKEIKDIKVKIEDMEVQTIELQLQEEIEAKVNVFSTSYSIEDKMKKNIYSFKIEL